MQKKKENHCTLFPEGNWSHCCANHDAAYREGGTRQLRKNADYELFCCVFDAGHPSLAILIYAAVRLFGGPFWTHKYRWGRGYKWTESNTYIKSTNKFFDGIDEMIQNQDDPKEIFNKLLKSHPSGQSMLKIDFPDGRETDRN